MVNVTWHILQFWQIIVDISKTVQDKDIYFQWKTNRKSLYGLSNGQTPVILDDLEGQYSYLTLFNDSLFGQIWHVLSWCTRIREHTWPATLNELEGYSSVSGLFKCISSTFVQRSNLQHFNWYARVARSLSDSWASCLLNEMQTMWKRCGTQSRLDVCNNKSKISWSLQVYQSM